MLTVTDLLFFPGLTMWVTAIIGMGSTSTFYDEGSKAYFSISVLFAWLIVAGTIIYKIIVQYGLIWG